MFFFQKPSFSVRGDAHEYRTPHAMSFLLALEWSLCQLCVKDPEIHGTMSKIDLSFWCGFSAECKLAFCKPSGIGFYLILF